MKQLYFKCSSLRIRQKRQVPQLTSTSILDLMVLLLRHKGFYFFRNPFEISFYKHTHNTYVKWRKSSTHKVQLTQVNTHQYTSGKFTHVSTHTYKLTTSQNNQDHSSNTLRTISQYQSNISISIPGFNTEWQPVVITFSFLPGPHPTVDTGEKTETFISAPHPYLKPHMGLQCPHLCNNYALCSCTRVSNWSGSVLQHMLWGPPTCPCDFPRGWGSSAAIYLGSPLGNFTWGVTLILLCVSAGVGSGSVCPLHHPTTGQSYP